MLSICVTVKNRSRVRVGGKTLGLFPRCVDSVRKALSGIEASELVVADWKSSDWPLKEWIEDRIKPVRIELVNARGPFNRGRGRNVAAGSAKGNVLCFLDADCTVSRGVVDEGISLVESGKAFFPVVYSFADPAHSKGWWRDYGFGNCFVSRELFQKSGGWPEYGQWGKEDDHFFLKLSEATEVIRRRTPGIQHQWHPDDLIWKNRYSENFLELKEEVDRAKRMRDLVARHVPDRSAFALLDEARTRYLDFGDRRIVNFLEKQGEYYGVPDDDETAIEQLRILLDSGVRYLTLSWICYWWLDSFPGFGRHLEERFLIRHSDEVAMILEAK